MVLHSGVTPITEMKDHGMTMPCLLGSNIQAPKMPSQTNSKGQSDWNKEVLHQPVATENSLLTNDVMLIPGKI